MPHILLQVEVIHRYAGHRITRPAWFNQAEITVPIPRDTSCMLGSGDYFPVRGLPHNMSTRTEYNHARTDQPPIRATCPTWLTYEEAKEAFEKLRRDGVLDQNPALDAALSFMHTLEESGFHSELRVVFWLNR